MICLVYNEVQMKCASKCSYLLVDIMWAYIHVFCFPVWTSWFGYYYFINSSKDIRVSLKNLYTYFNYLL